MELYLEKLKGRASEALVRTSGSKIASGVLGDNWSEGRFGCRWLGFFLRESAASHAQNEQIQSPHS